MNALVLDTVKYASLLDAIVLKGIMEGYQIFHSTKYIMEGQRCQIQEIGETMETSKTKDGSSYHNCFSWHGHFWHSVDVG
jgi:hypothetical protein